MATTLAPEHIKRFREDHALYCRTWLRIKTKPQLGKPSTIAPLEHNTAQRIVHAKCERQLAAQGCIRCIILKARQEGMSTYVGSRIYRGCTLWSHRRALVLADELDRGGEIFGIYERFDEEAPSRPPAKRTRKSQELSYEIDSRITVGTARDKNVGRSATLDYVHASEFAAWEYPDDVLAALLEAMPADAGEFWIESTAQGVGNAFHAMWLDAEAGLNGWLPIFLPWWIDEGYQLPIDDAQRADIVQSIDPFERLAQDIGITWEPPDDEIIFPELGSGARWDPNTEAWKLTPEQLAWRRTKIRLAGDPQIFKQENPSTALEAFLVSGAPHFDLEAINDLMRHTREPDSRGNFVRIAGGDWVYRPAELGFVKVWEWPDPNGHYVIGADTAEGKLAAARDASLSDPEHERGGRDFSSADVVKVSELIDHPRNPGQKVRVPCNRQVAQVWGRMVPSIFAEQVNAAASFWSCPNQHTPGSVRRIALTGVERNHSSGQTTLRELRDRLRHTNLFHHMQINHRLNKRTSELGWVTNGETRMPMLDDLAELVRTGQMAIPSRDTLRECSTFVRGDDGKPEAQEGCHDDRVISLGIANQMRAYHSCGEMVVRAPEPEFADTPTGWS